MISVSALPIYTRLTIYGAMSVGTTSVTRIGNPYWPGVATIGSPVWGFTEQANKWGYLNNPDVWPLEAQPNKIEFNEGSEITTLRNPVWRTDKPQFAEVPITPTHVPCGYWSKFWVPVEDTPEIVGPTVGAWRPAKSQFYYDLQLIAGNAFGSSYHSWIYFPNVVVPRYATIVDATVYCYSLGGEQPGTVNLKCYFNNVDNAVEPTNLAEAEALALTAPIVWNSVPSWGVYGTLATFPSVKDLVQVIVNRVGWVSGNSMMFVVRDNNSDYSATRGAETYRWVHSLAPRLVINFMWPGY